MLCVVCVVPIIRSALVLVPVLMLVLVLVLVLLVVLVVPANKECAVCCVLLCVVCTNQKQCWYCTSAGGVGGG